MRSAYPHRRVLDVGARCGIAGSNGAKSRIVGLSGMSRFKNFFQRLSQATESSTRSCLVVSLLATDPQKNDEVGKVSSECL